MLLFFLLDTCAYYLSFHILSSVFLCVIHAEWQLELLHFLSKVLCWSRSVCQPDEIKQLLNTTFNEYHTGTNHRLSQAIHSLHHFVSLPHTLTLCLATSPLLKQQWRQLNQQHQYHINMHRCCKHSNTRYATTSQPDAPHITTSTCRATQRRNT